MLTIAEAAKILNLSEGRTRALVNSGRLQAEKCGRQWMVYEFSVEQRKAKGGRAGRPKADETPIQTPGKDVQKAYALYKECTEFFSAGLSTECLAHAASAEELDFYVHMNNYFLGRSCQKLVEAGVF